ncbi:hypothetical protein [Candidatus Anaplasma sp. TIGMIC]|uniref:hypothetical protein n=1 Tax=Candidatus Anaplasma sp. TIGMIC TaxID=3020713 RepID=UPI00232C40F8|nr:hypothetical protein [Candidatus Anaplasma sp. TIGMIC]MDB1135470.1 hypothetical protein [Candidatus Anaplasma sp. TIGMIC]
MVPRFINSIGAAHFTKSSGNRYRIFPDIPIASLKPIFYPDHSCFICEANGSSIKKLVSMVAVL